MLVIETYVSVLTTYHTKQVIWILKTFLYIYFILTDVKTTELVCERRQFQVHHGPDRD